MVSVTGCGSLFYEGWGRAWGCLWPHPGLRPPSCGEGARCPGVRAAACPGLSVLLAATLSQHAPSTGAQISVIGAETREPLLPFKLETDFPQGREARWSACNTPRARLAAGERHRGCDTVPTRRETKDLQGRRPGVQGEGTCPDGMHENTEMT